MLISQMRGKLEGMLLSVNYRKHKLRAQPEDPVFSLTPCLRVVMRTLMLENTQLTILTESVP